MTYRKESQWTWLAKDGAELQIEHLMLEAHETEWLICVDSISGHSVIAEGRESGMEENKSAALRAANEIFRRGLEAVEREQVARDDAGLP